VTGQTEAEPTTSLVCKPDHNFIYSGYLIAAWLKWVRSHQLETTGARMKGRDGDLRSDAGSRRPIRGLAADVSAICFNQHRNLGLWGDAYDEGLAAFYKAARCNIYTLGFSLYPEEVKVGSSYDEAPRLVNAEAAGVIDGGNLFYEAGAAIKPSDHRRSRRASMPGAYGGKAAPGGTEQAVTQRRSFGSGFHSPAAHRRGLDQLPLVARRSRIGSHSTFALPRMN
jgi:hypothetical protein